MSGRACGWVWVCVWLGRPDSAVVHVRMHTPPPHALLLTSSPRGDAAHSGHAPLPHVPATGGGQHAPAKRQTKINDFMHTVKKGVCRK